MDSISSAARDMLPQLVGPDSREIEVPGPNRARLLRSDLGAVPKHAWPRLGQKNYPRSGRFHLDEASQPFRSPLQIQTVDIDHYAACLERTPFRYENFATVRPDGTDEFVRVRGFYDLA